MSVKVPTRIQKNFWNKYWGDERVGLSWYRPTRANVLAKKKNKKKKTHVLKKKTFVGNQVAKVARQIAGDMGAIRTTQYSKYGVVEFRNNYRSAFSRKSWV